MDELSTEKKREIVRRVFPALGNGGDPDIERYFELRKAGRMGAALDLYNGALRVRYPSDAARVALLRLYREADPRYTAFQESLVLELAEVLARRIRSNIDTVVAPIERADLTDPLRALKAVEGVLSRLPPDMEAALALLSRHEELARVLGHRTALARRALELVREYDAVARADSPADYDFIARSEALEDRKRLMEDARRNSAGSAVLRAAERAAERGDLREERLDFVALSEARSRAEESRLQEERRARWFDPERISFNETDRVRVEIPAALARREDRVLAFCAKYWNLLADASFERLVFLYSRKSESRHYEIFRRIKLGRSRRESDDDILSAVSGILSSNYSYSVSGDLYLQVMWRRIKARMDARAVEARLSVPGPESRVRRHGTASAGEDVAPTNAPSAAPVAPPPRAELAPPQSGAAALPARRSPDFAARAPDFAIRAVASRAAVRETARGAASARRAPDSAARIPAPPPVERRVAGPTLAGLPERRAHWLSPHGDNEPLVRSRISPSGPPESRVRAAALAAPTPTAVLPAEAAFASAVPARAAASPSPPAAVRAAPDPCNPSGSSRSGRGAGFEPAARATGARLLRRIPSGPEPLPEIVGRRGSISDKVRALSGRAYDVYREIFLERIRDHIRRALLASRGRRGGIFDTSSNEAEDQVFSFMAAHYNDPFMDWESSAERAAVEAMGFSLPSLDPLIEACFNQL